MKELSFLGWFKLGYEVGDGRFHVCAIYVVICFIVMYVCMRMLHYLTSNANKYKGMIVCHESTLDCIIMRMCIVIVIVAC